MEPKQKQNKEEARGDCRHQLLDHKSLTKNEWGNRSVGFNGQFSITKNSQSGPVVELFVLAEASKRFYETEKNIISSLITVN